MAIKLEKSGDQHRINLEKGNTSKEIYINLSWSQGKKGLLGLFKQTIDLDLGCFYELTNGNKTLIDGIQFSHGRGGTRNVSSKQGCYTNPPYIWHTGDDRGGNASSGENILVNPQGINEIKRIIVYTFIYEGVAKWDETNAVVTVKVPGCEEVVVEMGKQYSSHKFCAIAELSFGGDNSITVKKLITFHSCHSDCDKKYGWGFSYSPGSKD